MSEMGSDEFGSDEFPETPADKMSEAIIAFTGCIGEALDGICSYGWTIGESYVPFNPDEDDECEDDEAACSQAWVRVSGIGPGDIGAGAWGGNGCALTMTASLEVGVLRCFDIPEEGEAPTSLEVMAAAMQSMTDMQAILCAALNCGASETDPDDGVFAALDVGTWVPLGPSGGQYGGIWTFSIEFK